MNEVFIFFLQLAGYGPHDEQRYSLQFEETFPFTKFNKNLFFSHDGGRSLHGHASDQSITE